MDIKNKFFKIIILYTPFIPNILRTYLDKLKISFNKLFTSDAIKEIKYDLEKIKTFTANTVKEVKVEKIIVTGKVFVGDVIKRIEERKTAYLIISVISMLILLLTFFLEGRKIKKLEMKRKEFDFRIRY